MRFKSAFPLLLILIVLICIPIASASDGSADADNSTDLSVEIKTSHGNDEVINNTTYVSFTIYVTNRAETAYNTTVETVFMEGLRYYSHTPESESYVLGPLKKLKYTTDMNYTPDTGTWFVGDLKPNETKSLTLTSQLNTKDLDLPKNLVTFSTGIIALATSSSNETNLQNNIALKTVTFDNGTFYTSQEDHEPRNAHSSAVLINYDEYSNYRQVTESTDNRKVSAKTSQNPVSNGNAPNSPSQTSSNQQEGNSNGTNSIGLDENKTSNPIALALLSLTSLIATRFKTKLK